MSLPSPDAVGEVPEAIPAATVVVLRDGAEGLETLLLRRNSTLGFGAGMWVFPGGRVDEGDRDPERPDDEEAAARRAAVREAVEEAALTVDPVTLVAFSHWTPPRLPMRRFAAWYFLALAPTTGVEIDGGEIVDHVWVRPSVALERHAAREVELMPPTWLTLEALSPHPDVAAALAEATARPMIRYETRFAAVDGKTVALYSGDAGYDLGDPHLEGPRHRLWIGDIPWRYERD